MIISKKKFNKMVDEEVFKRLHEIEERRQIAEESGRLEKYIGSTDARVDDLRHEFEEFKRTVDVCIKELRADIRYNKCNRM